MGMLTTLRLFRLVAHYQSFTRAAEFSGLTRPAVSQQMKQLEQHFGVPLFDRSSRRVSLTPAGERLLPLVDEVLQAAERMEAAMAALRSDQQSVVTVAASTLPGESLLPRALPAFREAMPGVEVHVRVSNTETVLSWVREGQVDLGLVGQWVEEPGLTCRQVAEDEILLALPPGGLGTLSWDGSASGLGTASGLGAVSAEAPLPLALLPAVPLIMREPGSATRATVFEALRRCGIDPGSLRVAAEVGSPEAVKGAVRAGMGCAFVSAASLNGGELPAVRVEGLDLRRPVCACWLSHRELTPAQRSLLESLAGLK